MAKYLSLDWGKKIIGLAIGVLDNKNSPVIIPISPIQNTDLGNTLSQIKGVVLEYNIDSIVVGLPKSGTGEETKTSLVVKRFIVFLKRNLSLPVYAQNEYLTTSDALWHINSNSGNYNKHSISAAIILESFLEK